MADLDRHIEARRAEALANLKSLRADADSLIEALEAGESLPTGMTRGMHQQLITATENLSALSAWSFADQVQAAEQKKAEGERS